ncbi:MAG: hypothetical protein JW772_04710 [Candidatus Diapherotrites archaeon]|nr:hypothetical protein [Candidatus Diapherotrites archaeon]
MVGKKQLGRRKNVKSKPVGFVKVDSKGKLAAVDITPHFEKGRVPIYSRRDGQITTDTRKGERRVLPDRRRKQRRKMHIRRIGGRGHDGTIEVTKSIFERLNEPRPTKFTHEPGHFLPDDYISFKDRRKKERRKRMRRTSEK